MQQRRQQTGENKIPQNHVKVTAQGEPIKYIEYGKHLFNDLNYQDIKVMGSGKSIEVAVKVAEQLRQNIPGLHSTIDVSSVVINKKLDLPEGLLDEEDRQQEIQITKACITITLSKTQLDSRHYGYQKPLGAWQLQVPERDSERRQVYRGGPPREIHYREEGDRRVTQFRGNDRGGRGGRGGRGHFGGDQYRGPPPRDDFDIIPARGRGGFMRRPFENDDRRQHFGGGEYRGGRGGFRGGRGGRPDFRDDHRGGFRGGRPPFRDFDRQERQEFQGGEFEHRPRFDDHRPLMRGGRGGYQNNRDDFRVDHVDFRVDHVDFRENRGGFRGDRGRGGFRGGRPPFREHRDDFEHRGGFRGGRGRGGDFIPRDDFPQREVFHHRDDFPQRGGFHQRGDFQSRGGRFFRNDREFGNDMHRGGRGAFRGGRGDFNNTRGRGGDFRPPRENLNYRPPFDDGDDDNNNDRPPFRGKPFQMEFGGDRGGRGRGDFQRGGRGFRGGPRGGGFERRERSMSQERERNHFNDRIEDDEVYQQAPFRGRGNRGRGRRF